MRAIHLTCLALALTLGGCANSQQTQPAPAGGPLKVGELTGMDGKSYDVDAVLERGETVALVFWQTWCESCEEESPKIAQAAYDNAGKIRFLGIVPGKDETVDDGEVRATADTWGYATFPHVRDRDMSLCKRLGIKGTPTILVLGKGGEGALQRHRPPKDWTSFQGADFDPQTAGGCEGGVCPLPPEANE